MFRAAIKSIPIRGAMDLRWSISRTGSSLGHLKSMRSTLLLSLFCLGVPIVFATATPLSPDEAEFLAVDAQRAEFMLVLLPDTQRYARNNPAVFFSQTHWIRENRDALNIRFVIHLGDIVDDQTDREWRIADEAMGVLDEVVPYVVLPGNHDFNYDPKTNLVIKYAPQYNAVFPPMRFRDRPWYGGHRGVTNDNNYSFFNAAGRDFMILALEYGPSDEVLEWAGAIVRAHADKQVIVATHCYMYSDDTRMGPGDDATPHKHDLRYNDGEQMWEKFVRHHPNIFMVVSGHVTWGDMAGRLTSSGVNGNYVHQMLSNYQHLENGGNGWLRILKFIPGERKLIERTYSPWLKKFDHGPEQSFELELGELFGLTPKQRKKS
jgi:hypothetical protein